MTTTELRSATTLRPGDRIRMYDTWVTVLREAEPGREPWGAPTIRFWCKREDTDAEGFVTFGPTGVAHVALIESGGATCVLSYCNDPYHATAGGLDLCIDHFDRIKDTAP